MRLVRLFSSLGLALPLALLAYAPASHAADKNAPPQMEKLEEGEPPAVTIRAPSAGNTTITETRAPGGKVKQVKVSTGKSTYYLKPKDEIGNTMPGDMQSANSRPAQWEVMTFDIARNKKEQKEVEEAAAVPPPPPANPAPKKK